MKWQRTARLIFAAVAVLVAIGVGTQMKQRTRPKTEAPIPRSDPTALVESEGGSTVRIKGSREDGELKYERLLTYANGASKMIGVTITSERGGRSYVITGAEGQAGEGDTAMDLTGGVTLEASDGLKVSAERATYAKADNVIRVPGPVTFTRGRTKGSGVDMTFDQGTNVITIGHEARIDVRADRDGTGALSLSSDVLEMRRNERLLVLNGNASIVRDAQALGGDAAIAHMTEDEQHLQLLELHGSARIAESPASPGGLERLTGQDITLLYAADGRTLERANVTGGANLQIASGGPSQPGRQITAAALTIGLAPDGHTPMALIARDEVKLTLPGESGGPTRVIAAQTLDGTGDATRGLTGAHFTGNVQYSERAGTLDRQARSSVLDVALAPGFGAIEEATFTKGARFADGTMFATAASAKYALKRGVLELTGTEPASPTPHVVNDQITVDAVRIDVTLDGPVVKATGTVKSVLQPPKDKPENGKAGTDAKLPSMLKKDQPVNVTSDQMTYDGAASRAVYSGKALLWQGDTSVKGSTITIDSKSGDLAADGPVTTTTMLEQEKPKGGGREKVNSIGTSKTFAYVDSSRKATYTGDAHITGPQGDLTSPRVELFMKPSGDELDRAEAYESVTLRSDGRKTTGKRLTFFSADQRYLVTGTPVSIVDECGRETTGRTLTFFRATDRIVVDGNEQSRTQTKGNTSTCP